VMLAPKIVLIALGIFLVMVFAFRYVSLASIVTVALFPLFAWLGIAVLVSLFLAEGSGRGSWWRWGIVLLGAINLHRVELGLVLIVAFGLGMAVTLVGIGTALVSAGRLGEARLASHAALLRLYAYVPAAAAVAVLLLGIGMTAQSLAALARP